MDRRRGVTTLELLVAATIGMIVTGAALSLCATGNRVVGRLLARQAAWQEARAASILWATEWRGAGYDPGGTSGAGVTRIAPDSLEFSGDWNGNGSLTPTAGNPNERLAWATTPGAWKRGVNGGGRIAVAWPDSTRFRVLDANGRETRVPAAARFAEVEIVLRGRERAWVERMRWTIALRNIR